MRRGSGGPAGQLGEHLGGRSASPQRLPRRRRHQVRHFLAPRPARSLICLPSPPPQICWRSCAPSCAPKLTTSGDAGLSPRRRGRPNARPSPARRHRPRAAHARRHSSRRLLLQSQRNPPPARTQVLPKGSACVRSVQCARYTLSTGRARCRHRHLVALLRPPPSVRRFRDPPSPPHPHHHRRLQPRPGTARALSTCRAGASVARSRHCT